MNEIFKRNTTGLPAIQQIDPFLEYADSVLQSNIVGKLLKFQQGRLVRWAGKRRGPARYTICRQP